MEIRRIQPLATGFVVTVALGFAAAVRAQTTDYAPEPHTFQYVAPNALQFYPLAPCRVADTRSSQPFTGAFGPPSLAGYVSRNFPLPSSSTCSIPSTAQAYSLNFTAVPPGELDFLSVWPQGQPYPGVSTLNSPNGAIIANAAIVPAGTGGGITVLAADATDLIIDINGYFAPASGSGQDFFPLTPCRVADTRSTQSFTGAFGPPRLNGFVTRDFPVATSPCVTGSAPSGYSLNFTAVPPGEMDFLSVWPLGQPYPGVSTLNAPDGNVLANAAIVPAGTGGDIDVLAGNATDVVVDINGKFAAPGTGGLQFYPLTPCRVADTRSSQPFSGAFGPPSLASYVSRTFPVQSSSCGIPANAQAYALNITVVPQGPLDFLSVWPQGQPYPGVSTLNSTNGAVIANAAIVPAGTNGGITMLASNPTDLIIDIVGYFAPAPPPTLGSVSNTDSALNTGVANSTSCAACANSQNIYTVSTGGGTQLWTLALDNWNLSQGSGLMSSSYNPVSGVSWTINWTGGNNAIGSVNGYPFIMYGGDDWQATPGNQGPVFPVLLSDMSSLVVEINYSLTCNPCATAMDVMFDLYLVPTPTFTGGQPQSQEISIFDYQTFWPGGGCGGTPTTTLNQTIMVNGVATPVTWDICIPSPPIGQAANQTIVMLSQGTGRISGDISFDQAPILKAVAALSGTSGYYMAGDMLGTEWATNGSPVNFTFNLSKYLITQTLFAP